MNLSDYINVFVNQLFISSATFNFILRETRLILKADNIMICTLPAGEADDFTSYVRVIKDQMT